jgi:hypothetical protein
MKRTATEAGLMDSDSDKEKHEAKRISRMQLEAMAQGAMRDGLSKEQVAYEQWVDTQPIGEVVSWDEMGEEGRRGWCLEHGVGYEEAVASALGEEREKENDGGQQIEERERADEDDTSMEREMAVQCTDEGTKDEAAVGDLGDNGRWIAVRTIGKEHRGDGPLVDIEHEASPVASDGMFFIAFSPLMFIASGRHTLP